MKEKALSVGTIVSDGQYILGCLPFGRKNTLGNYDLPKGHLEKGETPAETAVREMFEETGYVVKEEWLTDLGRYEYIPLKDLHIFFTGPDTLPQINTLKCTSYFDYKGRQVPEMVGYKWIPLKELQWFFPSMQAVIEKALDNFVEEIDPAMPEEE